MFKYLIAAGAIVVAGVPAAVGLAGNDSFTRDVPVRVPEQAQVVPADDDGTADQGPGDAPTNPRPSGHPTSGADDHGGRVPRDDRTEAGDDRSGTEAGDDGGHHQRGRGSDDSGSDDSGSDDSGSHHSGSDDGGHHGGSGGSGHNEVDDH
jgi:hypothetical protein